MLRKLVLASVALLGPVTVFSTPALFAQEAVKDQSPVLLEVKDKNFSVEVPFDWVKDKSREGLDLFVYAPVAATDKIALTNVSVVAGKVNKDLTLANFYKANVDNLPKAFDDFAEVTNGTGGIPNEKTNWVMFNRKLRTEAGEITLTELQYYLIVGEYGYVITFSATPNEFVINRGKFERIITSFKILQPPVTLPVEIFRTLPVESSAPATPATPATPEVK